MIEFGIFVLIIFGMTVDNVRSVEHVTNKINAPAQPHIIFILADDLGWNDVSFHGYKQIPTPNIDSLALDGVILNRYYVAPACTPSRAALLTAKYPFRFGLQNTVLGSSQPYGLPLGEKILPQYLKDLNYLTHGIGKWNMGHFKSEYLPMNRGFDSFFGFWNPEKDYYTHISVERTTGYTGFDLHDNFETAWEYNGTYGSDLFTDKARDIIMAHDPNKPLFLYLSQQSPHSGNLLGEILQASEKYTRPLSYIKDENRRTYGGMLCALDDSVGDVVEALDQSGLLDNSVIIFSSDNGVAVDGAEGPLGSNYPLKGGKRNLWEGSVRGVSFVWSPLLRHNSRVSSDLMHITDWLPTLLSAAAVSNHPDITSKMDGVNMWPTLVENVPSPRDSVLLNVNGFGKSEAYIWRNYKIIKGSFKDGAFDIWSDKDGRTINGTLTDESPEALDQYEQIYKMILDNSEYGNPGSKKMARSDQCDTNGQMSEKQSCEEESCVHQRDKYFKNSNLIEEVTGKSEHLRLSKVARILQRKYDKSTHTALSCEIHGCENIPTLTRCGARLNESFPPEDRQDCNIQAEFCLFDIEKDPCEYSNIADQFPDVVSHLKAEIDKYRPFVAKDALEPSDPLANPEIRDGVWNPWM